MISHTDHSPELQELEGLVATARAEASPIRARSLLRKTAESCQQFIKRGIDVRAVALVANSALSELAMLEDRPAARTSLRRAAIAVCRTGLGVTPSSDLVIALANSVVDHFYDRFARETFPAMRQELANAKSVAQAQIISERDLHQRVLLLSQVSSLLRCQAQATGPENRPRRLAEAVRTAERATREAPDMHAAQLELGQALWASARWEPNEQEYFSQMRRAEQSLAAATGAGPLPLLVLARYYRQTYQPAQAVELFERYAAADTNHRRALAESFTLGEAALQLWYRDPDSETSARALASAQSFLREAVDFGYENARIFTALAHAEAANGDVPTSAQTLRRLGREPVSSWIDVIRAATSAVNKEDVPMLDQAFALGVGEGAVWNSLGTYARQFLKDEVLALSLYEVGHRLDPKNAVILTNLARSLVGRGDQDSLTAAKKYLDRAAQYADRSFVWWRAVRSSLENRPSAGEGTAAPRGARIRPGLVTFGSLVRQFTRLCGDEVTGAERGQQFQHYSGTSSHLRFPRTSWAATGCTAARWMQRSPGVATTAASRQNGSRSQLMRPTLTFFGRS